MYDQSDCQRILAEQRSPLVSERDRARVEVAVGNIIGFVIKAVLFDFGGVVTTSPFEAFTRYETANGLPDGFIRSINATNPDTNAWAKLERSDVDTAGFAELFEAEAAERGHTVDGRAVLALLSGEVRPKMVEAIRRIKSAGFATACLTNNIRQAGTSGKASANDRRPTDGNQPVEVHRAGTAAAMALFDHVTESSVVGIRKPEPEFYRMALAALSAKTQPVEPSEAVFLDDLGVNLKPAKAMGITTIKVVDPDQALAELGTVIGLDLVG